MVVALRVTHDSLLFLRPKSAVREMRSPGTNVSEEIAIQVPMRNTLMRTGGRRMLRSMVRLAWRCLHIMPSKNMSISSVNTL